MPVVRPLAWRARTFMARPTHEVEARVSQRLEAIESNTSSRLDHAFEQVLAALRTHDAAAVRAMREQRKLHATLRQLIEENAGEIQELRTEVSRLRELLGADPKDRGPAE